ncbi:MAG TPA: lactate permease LctP family transporter, partial [Thermoanaerobaculia bacterium]|nr:lactate permease LctP family transporter [Thermoanaerobaculia bacterium]
MTISRPGGAAAIRPSSMGEEARAKNAGGAGPPLEWAADAPVAALAAFLRAGTPPPERSPVNWTMPVEPLGSAGAAALVAAAPLVLLFVALVVLGWKALRAGIAAAALATLLAVAAFGMPLLLALAAVAHGTLFALVPIAPIVVGAVFVQDVARATGSFDRLRRALASATPDRALQALLVAFGFGALLEGSTGFGAPVAISAGILAGLGFPPLAAAGLCLLANTVPVAFAAVGLPIAALSQATGLPEAALGAATARLLAPLALGVPLLVVLRAGGRRPSRRALGAAVTAGLAFSATQLLLAETLGPQLPALAGAIAALASVLPFARGRSPGAIRDAAAGAPPFFALAILVTGWSLPPVRALLSGTTRVLEIPLLHGAVVDPARGALPATWSVPWLAGAGTAILLAGLLSSLLGGLGAGETFRLLGGTAKRLLPTVAAVAAFLALASVATYSGMMSALGRALAASGPAFPFLSPAIGWLGVLITGSDMASNVVFGRLQVTAAAASGMPELLAAASNAVGGTTGKMVSPQSIAVACAAAGLSGREGETLRKALPLSLGLCAAVGLLSAATARLAPALVPPPVAGSGAVVAGPASGLALLGLCILVAGLVARRGS